MGSEAHLTLGDVTLASSKREADPSILAVFRESDRRLLPFPLEYWQDEPETAPEHTLQYVLKLRHARDRLDLMGITLDAVRKEFARGIKEELERPKWSSGATGPGVERYERALEEELLVLKDLSLEQWTEGFLHLSEGRYRDIAPYSDEFFQIPPLYRRMLRAPFDFNFGFPSDDSRFFIRAIAEIANLDSELIYDLTELIADEYVGIDEQLAEWAARLLSEDAALVHRIIVLTEGSVDRWAISHTLGLLYPHLSEYFSFLDFEGMRMPGGAGFLMATVKAFAGAGVANRVVGVFDNDTAGHAALAQLRTLRLPQNIRVLTYPDIPIAKAYPALGPTGLTVMDVNGMAASIEMYFGRDVLTGPDGDLTPIQWRGFDEKLGRYQGELIDKRSIQDAFRKKGEVDRAEAAHAIGRGDWADMRAVVDAIRHAFN